MPFIGSAIAAVVGAVGSVITGVAGFLGGTSLLAGVARLGLGIAAKYALNAFFGPDEPERPAMAVQLETQYGENLVRTVVLGTVGHAGHHVYRNAYGKGNHIVQDVYVLSHFRISGVSRVRFQGAWRTLGGSEDSEKGFRIQGIDAQVWVKVYKGTMGQTADAALISHSNPSGRWTTDHRGAGVAYAIVTSVLDREHLPNPWEAFFEVKGAPLYDWRKDTTVGGTGSHRWDDQDTWEFDETHNPVLMMYALERGIFNGTEKMVGKGISPSKLPLSRWTIAANIAEESASGGTRYRASCITTSGPGRTHENNMAPLRESCAASWVELVDGEYPIVGAEQAVVATFTDDDLVVGQPYRYSAKRTRSELVNTVAGSFIDPSNFYQSVPFATRIDDAALSEDGERLAASIPYGAVTVPECVDRLADIAIRASRYQASAEIWLRPKFLTLKPGDWVKWDSTRNGTKTFQVLSKQLGPFGSDNCRNVHVALQEVSAGVFDPTAYVTTPPDGAIQGTPDFLTEVQNFIVSGISVEVDNNSMPALRATWSAIDDPTVTAVEVQWWPTDQATAKISVTVPVDQTVMVTLNVVASTEYQVRTRLVTRPYRVVAWSDPKPATTPSAGYALYPISIDDVADDLAGNLAWIGTGLREHVQRLQEIDLWIADQDFGNEYDRQQIRTQLTATFETAQADYNQKIDVLAATDVALASQITTLTATVGTKADASTVSALSAEVHDSETGLIANANAITAMDSTVGNFSASGLFRVETVATETGASSTIGMSAVASDDDETGQAALFLSALTGGKSRISLLADQTFILTSAGTLAAMFDGDTTYINNARIRNLDADNIDVETLTSTEGFFEYLEVETGMIAAGAVTSFDTDAQTIAASAYSGWRTILQATVNSDSGCPVVFFINASVIGSRVVTNPVQFSTVDYRLVRLNDGHVLNGGQFTVPVIDSGAGGGYSPFGGATFPTILFDEVAAGSGYSYAIQVKSDDGAKVGGEGSWLVQCNRK